MSKIIDGREIARQIRQNVKKEIASKKLIPGLTAILVGNNEASKIYVNLKERAAKRAGINFKKIILPETTTQEELLTIINEENQNKATNAILVQLPLPKQINANIAIQTILPEKDVDGFHPANTKKFINGESKKPPVLTQAILSLLKATNENLQNKQALILANNPEIFAPPIQKALKDQRVTSTIAKPDEEKTLEKIKQADILIVAIGRPNFITPEKIKKDAIIIDIGTNKVDGKIVGDVSESTDTKTSWRSPSPGGIGPVTVANLLRSTLDCAIAQSTL